MTMCVWTCEPESDTLIGLCVRVFVVLCVCMHACMYEHGQMAVPVCACVYVCVGVCVSTKGTCDVFGARQPSSGRKCRPNARNTRKGDGGRESKGRVQKNKKCDEGEIIKRLSPRSFN